MFPSVLLERLILIFAWCILPLVYDIELVGLLEDPKFPVGMISGFTRGAMNPTYLVQNFVQAGQFISSAFKGWLLLTWPRASESGVYRRALRVVFFILTLIIFVASGFPVFISNFGCTWVAGATSG